MPEYPVLREAEFDPKVKKYYLIGSLIICVVSIVGVVFIPVVLFLGNWFVQKYLDNLSCTLTERTLELRRGVLSRVESTIPLEKITDLQMYQGPIMRAMGLYGFKVETAGQTTAAGSLLTVVGIVGAPGFRQGVLEQRDRVAGAAPAGATPEGAASRVDADGAVLVEIRDALLRIEGRLGEGRDGR